MLIFGVAKDETRATKSMVEHMMTSMENLGALTKTEMEQAIARKERKRIQRFQSGLCTSHSML